MMPEDAFDEQKQRKNYQLSNSEFEYQTECAIGA
jgi:hypothetical protein